MPAFERSGACLVCAREYAVSGRGANPDGESETAVWLRCACGGELAVFLPGSTNRERLEVAPRAWDDAAAGYPASSSSQMSPPPGRNRSNSR